MTQGPYTQVSTRQQLSQRLHKLAFREQLELLLRATRHLSNRERAEILGAAGIHFLKTRFITIVLHFLFKRFIKGVIWAAMYLVIALACLLLLAVLEQTNPRAVSPLIAAAAAFFVGFLVYTICDIAAYLFQFLRRTLSKEEREQLLGVVVGLDPADRLAVLRSMSIELSHRGFGESFLSEILSGFALLLAAALIIVLVLVICALLPRALALPPVLLPAFFAILAFLTGFFVPRLMQRRHATRSQREIYAG